MKRLLTLLLLVTLTACGGESSNTAPPVTIPATITPITIVAIGDSTTAGAVSVGATFQNIPEASYPARLQGVYGSKAVVTNLGINSSNLLEVMEHQYDKAVKLRPNVLIIDTTLNDSGDKIDKQLLLSIYKKISLENPKTRILLLTPTKAHKSIDNLQEYRDNLFLAANTNVEVVDIGAKAQDSWYCGYEDFHPCEYGYREKARVIFEYLNKEK